MLTHAGRHHSREDREQQMPYSVGDDVFVTIVRDTGEVVGLHPGQPHYDVQHDHSMAVAPRHEDVLRRIPGGPYRIDADGYAMTIWCYKNGNVREMKIKYYSGGVGRPRGGRIRE